MKSPELLALTNSSPKLTQSWIEFDTILESEGLCFKNVMASSQGLPKLLFQILKSFLLLLLKKYVFININFIDLQVFLPVSLVTEVFPPILRMF